METSRTWGVCSAWGRATSGLDFSADALHSFSMNHHGFNPEHLALTRRQFLGRCGMGMGALGLAGLLGNLGCFNAAGAEPGFISPLTPKAPHFPARAKRVIHIFANGGPSHVDTFDPKPALDRYAGKLLPKANLQTERPTGAAFASPFKFK